MRDDPRRRLDLRRTMTDAREWWLIEVEEQSVHDRRRSRDQPGRTDRSQQPMVTAGGGNSRTVRLSNASMPAPGERAKVPLHEQRPLWPRWRTLPPRGMIPLANSTTEEPMSNEERKPKRRRKPASDPGESGPVGSINDPTALEKLGGAGRGRSARRGRGRREPTASGQHTYAPQCCSRIHRASAAWSHRSEPWTTRCPHPRRQSPALTPNSLWLTYTNGRPTCPSGPTLTPSTRLASARTPAGCCSTAHHCDGPSPNGQNFPENQPAEFRKPTVPSLPHIAFGHGLPAATRALITGLWPFIDRAR